MSYKYKILGDNPIGYWDLAYQSTSSSINPDLTTYGNNASFSGNVLFSVPPLIPNSGSIAKFVAGTSSVQILNRYDAFNVNATKKSFSMEFWLSFNNLFSGNGYGSSYFTNNQLNLIKIINSVNTNTIGRIYFDYPSNTIRFSINGTGNQDAIYYLKNIDRPLHVVVNYDGQTSIFVNGEKGYSGTIYDYSSIRSASLNTNVKYIIDSLSLQSNSSSASYLISNLAFYNYKLDVNKVKSHITLANLEDLPNRTSIMNNSIDFFDIRLKNDMFAFYKRMAGKELKQFKSIYNLEAGDLGVSTKYLNNLYANSTYYINSSSGAYWTGSTNYLSFRDFGKNINKNFTVYMTVSSSVGASNQFLMSLTNINNGTVFLQKNPPSSSGYFLYHFNEAFQSLTLLASANYTNTQASGFDNVLVSFDNQNVYLYASNTFVQKPLPNLGYTNGIVPSINTSLIVGANSISNSACASNNTTFFSNVGLYDYTTNNATNASSVFSTKSNYMFLSPLTSDLSISQYGYVIYEMNTGFFKTPTYGTFVKWDSLDNVKSEVSYDNGYTWSNIYTDNYLYNYNNSVPQEKTLVRFTFNQNFSASLQTLKVNNFEFGLLKNVSIFSDFNKWSLTFPTSSFLYTHSIRNSNNKVVSRPRNFGITFKPDLFNIVQGYGLISGTSSAYGTDFWMRIDDLQNTYSAKTPNLIFNGDFEISAASGWNLPTNGAISINPAYSGSSLFLGGAVPSNNEWTATNTASIFVSPGDTFYGEIWKYYSSASGKEMEYFTTYNAAGTALSYYNLFVVNQASAVAQNQWIKYTGSFTVTDSTAVFMRANISLRNYPSEQPGFSGSAYFDNFILRKQPNYIYLLNTASYSLYYTASNPVLQWASATNLIPNPSLETNTSYIGFLGGTFIRTNETSAAFGQYVGKITSNSAQTIGPYFLNTDGNRLPISANKTYTFSIYVKDGNTGVQFQPSIEWYTANSGGTAISVSTGGFSSISSNGWTRLTATGTAPGTANYGTPTLYGAATSTNQYFYFDAAQLEQGSLSQYNDPSIFFVYINGASISNQSFKLIPNEIYHLGISHSYPVSGSFNINGGVLNSTSVNANATYGFISMWNVQPQTSDIQYRYSIYTSNSIQVASAADTSVFLRQPGYYDAASAYYIG